MSNYTQITYEERVVIADLWRKHKSYYFISKWLDRKYDTIKNEIERNGIHSEYGRIKYKAKKAQSKYLERRQKYDNRIIENNKKLEEKISNLIIEEQYSPDQIAGRFKTVSHQTIYNWVYRMEDIKLKKKIVKNLRRKGKKYRKTSKLHTFESITAPKTMIDKRPKIIDNRKRLGDFEGDTVILNDKQRLYTLVDRKSGYTFIRHIQNGFAQTIYDETIDICKKNNILSITYDNGVEFSYHDLISLDTGLSIYFCFPYHSWEKGTNENTNGLIRQYYPKKTVHDNIKKSDIIKVQNKLNNRPRKRLNYLTPYEVFVKKMNPQDFLVQPLI
jgi:IS30 family transposase